MSQEKSVGERSYEQFAQRYAQMLPTKPHNAYYEQPAIFSLLPDVTGKRVLDAGCGPGLGIEKLLKRGAASVVGMDITPDFVRIAQERVGDRAAILRGDLTAPLPFEDASFDLVFSSLVMHYIRDTRPLMREFARILRGGGWLVFSEGHPAADYNFVRHRLPDQEWHYFDTEEFTVEWGGFGEPKPQITSYRRSLQELLNPVLEAGLRLDHVLEPLPTQEFLAADPEDYHKLMQYPGFICLRVQKL